MPSPHRPANPFTVFGPPTLAGRPVNKETAMTLSAVYASIRILANYVSMIPLKLFRETEKGRQPATSHPLYRVLNAQPNNYMSSFVFRRCIMESLLVDGNLYREQLVALLSNFHPHVFISFFPDGLFNVQILELDTKNPALS